MQEQYLNVARIIENTEAEGPGKRFALWVQGCPFRCKGCCNPEFLSFKPASSMLVSGVTERALASGAEGISLLGGEPFAQAEALGILAQAVRAAGLSVMVYTGYLLERLREMPEAQRLLAHTDLLVDGLFELDKLTTGRRWIGSSNQTLHFLTNRYDPKDPQFSAPNQIEIRIRNGEILVNGWPLDGAKKILKVVR